MTVTQRYWIGNLAILAAALLFVEPLLLFAMMLYSARVLEPA